MCDKTIKESYLMDAPIPNSHILHHNQEAPEVNILEGTATNNMETERRPYCAISTIQN